MEKDRTAFIEDKKCKSIQKLKMLQTLKAERDNLRQIIYSFEGGQHAKRTSEVIYNCIFSYKNKREIYL